MWIPSVLQQERYGHVTRDERSHCQGGFPVPSQRVESGVQRGQRSRPEAASCGSQEASYN